MSQRQVAIEGAEHIRLAAEVLCKEKQCIQFCSALKVALRDVVEWLESSPNDNASTQREIGQLLGHLEVLCGLRRVVGLFKDQRVAGKPAPRPARSTDVHRPKKPVTRPWVNSHATTQSLRSIASDRTAEARKERKKVLDALRAFVTPALDGVDISPSSSDLPPTGRQEFQREMDSLLKALRSYCSEDMGSLCGQVVAQVRLHSLTKADSKVSLGMLFLDHPHKLEPEMLSCWQDTHISIPQYVRFSDEKSSVLPAEVAIDRKKFCEYISTRSQAGLCLLLAGDTLRFQGPGDLGRTWVPSSPTISLGQLLTTCAQQLTGKLKPVLACLIAKAVWQLYSSRWMTEPWTKDSVQFLLEQRVEQGFDVAGIFVNEPLLTMPCHADQSTPSSFEGQIQAHSLPKIFALGMMLLEIELGRSIESLWDQWPQFCLHGRPNINTNYNICRSIIKDRDVFEDTPDPLENIIMQCLQPQKHFMPHFRDEDRIRDALQELVNPLENYISMLKPHKVRPLCLPTPSPAPMQAIGTLPQLPIRLSNPQTQPLASHLPNATSSSMWFKRLDSLNHVLQAEPGDSYRKVRIAVLDTGVDPQDAVALDLAGYRDFVDGDDSQMRDNSGHGTKSLNLIFQVCEPAEVFALRIFDWDEESHNTQDLATQAIGWSIENNIDIVCMACGFREHNQELLDQIKLALTHKILFFAAASNDSNAGEVAYPARHHDQVLCMFSTDGGIKNSRSLNPGAGSALPNLAILGENVAVSPGSPSDSGTSISTAIAVGLAARLLDFSRQPSAECLIRAAPSLREKAGMSRLLMTISQLDEMYHCIRPWALLPPLLRNRVPFEGPLGQAQKTRAREDICETISRCLEGL
ncbi:hypothetical protein GQ53DRAFT_813446 [Thozetella sp. PMI_491]|nr:hypothetical protein GQ53DRAFT_813446 [Thozetella sp. PMI_491]